jgi:hypothetical protein
VPSDDERLERALRFSGSYISDDGRVTIRRAPVESSRYSAAPFLGRCDQCSAAGATPPGGEPLPDIRAAARFLAAHHHGEVD